MARKFGTDTLPTGASVFPSMCYIWITRICSFRNVILRIKRGIDSKALPNYFDLLCYLQTLPSLVAARGRRQLNNLSSDDMIIPNATSKTSLINHGESLDDYGATSTAEHSQSSSSSNSEHDSSRLESHTPPFLTRGLLLIYLNYAALSFLDMGHFVLLPLFYSTSISLGGLGLDPFRIGVTFGTFGCINAVIQANALGPLIRKYGARKMYIVSFPGLIACFSLYPVMRYFAQISGRVDAFVIACMMIQMSFYMCIYMAYGTYYELFILWCEHLYIFNRFHAGVYGTACCR